MPTPPMRDAVRVKYLSTNACVEPDRLEDLRAAVALQRRDAHLGHHLEDALVERVDVVLDRLLVRDADEDALADHVVERFERQVRIDRAGAVAEQQRAVMHFARVARFDDQRAARARALADQVMVDAGRREQARNRRADAIGVAVRQDQDRVAGFDRVVGAALQILERALEARAVLRRVEQHRQADRAEARVVDVAQLARAGSLSIIGYLITICRHDSGRGSSRLPSGPIVDSIEVTSSSRIASSGGLVTCANTCLK